MTMFENRKQKIREALLLAAKRQFLDQQQQQQKQQQKQKEQKKRQHGESFNIQNKLNEENLFTQIENTKIFQEESKSSKEVKIPPSTLAAPISPSPMQLIDIVLPQLNLSERNHSISSSSLPMPKKKKLLIDFGVGDGRWVISASKAYGCRSIGYDVNIERLTLAQQKITLHSTNIEYPDAAKNNNTCDNPFPYKIKDLIQLERRDAFQALQDQTNHSITQADVFVFYLFREALFQISSLLKQRGFLPTLPNAMTRNDSIQKKRKDDNINIDYNTGMYGGYTDDNKKNMKAEPNTPDMREIFKDTQIISVGFALPCWSSPVWCEKCCGIPVYLYNAYRRL